MCLRWRAGSTRTGSTNSFVEIRLAQLPVAHNSVLRKPAPKQNFVGPATLPVNGINQNFLPKGISLQKLLDIAWDMRNSNALPELESGSVCILRDSELQELERKSPWAAAHARQQTEQTRASIKRTKVTRSFAYVLQLIVKQYGECKPQG